MGCDIHAHIEYYDKNASKHPVAKKLRATPFSCNIQLGRNYPMFSILAGVRGMTNPVASPRGLPYDPPISLDVKNHYYARVVETEQEKHHTYNRLYGGVVYTKAEADEFLADGLSTAHPTDNCLIKNPAWHTASYLYVDELIQARRLYLYNSLQYNSDIQGERYKNAIDILDKTSNVELMKHVFGDIESVGLNAAIASMIVIERSGNYTTRFVFWFDS